MIIDDENFIEHYGTPRHSGRYPWGSGGDDVARNRSFLGEVEALKKQGLSEVEIARGLGIVDAKGKPSTTFLRLEKTLALNATRAADIAEAQRLKTERGMSIVAIAARMGRPESSIRAMLAPGQKDKLASLHVLTNLLRDQVAEKGLIDVGAGVERQLGVKANQLKAAKYLLAKEGYKVHYVPLPQMSGKGTKTTQQVLAAPGKTYSEVYKNRDQVQQITAYSSDGGKSFDKIHYPVSINSKRVGIRYAEQGGAKEDGVIYLRPGVDELSLGGKNYAQVRIAVDNTHYLKGMAIYKEDLPPGVDVVFNTNKSNTGNKFDAMKKFDTADPESPFGSTIKRQHGVINLVNEEGDWQEWAGNLSSQMLGKQNPKLIKERLDETHNQYKKEMDEILTLTNPIVKQKLLLELSETIDSSANHLEAAGLKRTATHVIMPIPSLKENEIYAPNYRDGERVVLIRHPHAGTFEIPELVVNNKNREAKKSLGAAIDAVGIHPKAAEKLSGADFDGDTVIVIPNNDRKIKSSPALEGLKNFDPKSAYPGYPGMKPMSGHEKQTEMGKISNLITDMQLRGASADELARAVRHSMVVIDAEKHHLNFKESEKANNILDLKRRYQQVPGNKGMGAATLLSKAGAKVYPLDRKPRPAAEGGFIDKNTGEKVYVPTGKHFVNAKGETVYNTTRSKKLAETQDAHTLSSGTLVEGLYADHSNSLKAMANEARRIAVNTKPTPYSPAAKAAYHKEVASLDAKIDLAEKNAPLERQALVFANAVFNAKKAANPFMDEKTKNKVRYRALVEARHRVGADKHRIEISDSEWAAIQAGAIAPTKLKVILKYTNTEHLKQLATPRRLTTMTNASASRARQMLDNGHSYADIADALGVSVSTVKRALDLKGKKT